MRSALKKDPIDHQTGHFGTSRLPLDQFDVSTQSDIQHQNLNYGSEDEIMGRLYGHEKRADISAGKSVAHYSKQDILEQYCISERGLGALENGSYSFFGCLSSHHNSSCSSRSASSFLTACVRQKVSSDENLYELYKRHPYEYAPFPKKQRYPWSPVTSEMYSHDHDLKSSYFRRKPYADPSRYTWMPSDDESIRMEKPKSIIDLSYRNQMIPQSKKHVSFARSHTLTSFDDAMSSLSSSSSHLNRITRSQERLLEVKKVDVSQAITKQPEFMDKLVLDKVKRGPMKTQATQTDNILGRKPLTHVNLSPRTVQRVKMVSQAAQTNGINGRRLIKSLSEAGHKFPCTSKEDSHFFGNSEHEPLHRTQSDEPPRSPYIDTSPTTPNPPEDQPQSESSSISKSDDHGSEDSVEAKKEIFIDFKPQVPTGSGNLTKRPLIKTFSDGVILMEKRRANTSEDGVVPNMRSYSSISHENIQITDEVQKFVPHFQKAPIKNEGICKPLEENIYSSIDGSINPQDSIDEEFHENLIYHREYNRQESLDKDLEIISERSPSADESIVPSIYLRADMTPSPFASSDSLANDAKDQSDDIWNESQVTVLQVDSGTDTGTLLSTSEVLPPSIPGSTAILTPQSRRKHLLMWQHQQRSSIDTEDLDKECNEQDVHLKLVLEKSPNKLKVPNTLQVITKQSSSCLRIGQPRTLSPSRRRRLSESPPVLAESPLPAVVPDLLLARTDSCKTNTDLSESTTTDDYITANSGTDSSRKSASFQGSESHAVKQVMHDSNLKIKTKDRKKQEATGSSFDSAKGSLDAFTLDDMVVPSISPSIPSERYLSPDTNISGTSYVHTPVPQIRTGRSTPSEDSSSCGSYSVGGSTPDLLESLAQTEEHTTTRRRKDFQLDLANNAKSGSSAKVKHKSNDMKLSPQQESLKVTNEKAKRSKGRTRSPLQGHKKNFQGRKSPHKEKTCYPEDRSYKATSDESSTGREYTISQTSPRKLKKNKESSRRKSLPRSPNSQKSQKKNDVEYQPSSLPGSLSRRKSAKKSAQPEKTQYKHSNAYPKQTDTKKSPTTSAKEATTLKALSAESLRSVSPGSDSVFYSETNSHATEHHMHCLHCGKEVEVNTDEADKSSNGHQPVIVQPPAGFEDSPKVKGGRLFKKSDKRLKSEEKGPHEQKRHRYRPDMRAKSEERGGATATLRGRLRPMQRSPYCSKEHLKAADSSPSILPGAPEEDNDQGIYSGCYSSGQWFCINEADKVLAVFSPTESESIRRGSISSTESEHDFCKRYQGVAHRVVHRKPYVDMYKRLHLKSFDNESICVIGSSADMKQKLEEVFKLMLTIWCKEHKALKLISGQSNECDKTVVVQRDSGEFGFRIHGSKPVVVTAIEPGTPAESSGLEVGDIIISVNGVNVLDRSHSDVVQIAHAGSDTLTLEVARTSYALNTAKEQSESCTLYSGYLWKMSGYAKGNTTNKWTRRWFCLKKDNCLYYYKTDSDKQPVGVVMLFDQEIRELDADTEPSKPNKFVIQREESVPLYLAADTLEARSRWIEVIEKTVNESQAVDEYLEETKRNLTLSPNSVSDPDCFGYLIKLGTQWKSWSRRYCVLKDAALYFYQDSNSTNAFGVALLHGYKVQQSSSSKKHSFEIVPPDPSKKHYYFHAESDTDRRRWISALEYSIDRWLVHQ